MKTPEKLMGCFAHKEYKWATLRDSVCKRETRIGISTFDVFKCDFKQIM